MSNREVVWSSTPALQFLGLQVPIPLGVALGTAGGLAAGMLTLSMLHALDHATAPAPQPQPPQPPQQPQPQPERPPPGPAAAARPLHTLGARGAHLDAVTDGPDEPRVLTNDNIITLLAARSPTLARNPARVARVIELPDAGYAMERILEGSSPHTTHSYRSTIPPSVFYLMHPRPLRAGTLTEPGLNSQNKMTSVHRSTLGHEHVWLYCWVAEAELARECSSLRRAQDAAHRVPGTLSTVHISTSLHGVRFQAAVLDVHIRSEADRQALPPALRAFLA